MTTLPRAMLLLITTRGSVVCIKHIQRAVLIDQGQDDFLEKAKAALPIEKTIAIYCRSGRRSASAATRLSAAGYKCVNLNGGIMAWQEAGKPVAKGR